VILGAIGPLGVRIEPFGELGAEEAAAAFGRQVEGLLAGGVDGFVLETFSDIAELEAAIRAVRARSDLALAAQVTVGQDLRTAYGTAPEVFGPALETAGADVVGINCSIGPQVVLEAVERLAACVSVPISALPNAGLPREVADRKIYMASPEYMAEYARRMVEAGARFVGGCCGTTPEHIRAMRSFVRSVTPLVSGTATMRAQPNPGAEPVPLAERSRLGAKLARGEWIRTVEIVPPRGVDPAPMLAQARALRDAGVDAVNVPDGPRAQSRMGALISGLMIEREVGIETVVHYCCRDRNLLGMLSDLLGASAAGLRNLLIITGDPPKMGPYPEATAVFDIDAIGLTNLVARLNRGLDPGGNAIGAPTRFVHGVGVNPAAVDLERELRRFAWKAEAGACFAMTQPVFDVAQLERFLPLVEEYHVPIIAGIWPLVSLRNAEFLANEVPGVTVPDAVIVRMRKASEKGKEAALAEGVAIAREMAESVRTSVRGIQVAAPLGRVEVAVDVLASIDDRR
jgi:homocysteine S-methyltransferase